MQIRLWHLFARPTSQFSQNTGRHVHNETILSVQQIQKWSPNILFALRCIIVEDLDARTVLLQQIIDHDQNVLNGLILGDVRQQVQECLGSLVGILLEILASLFAVQRTDALVIFIVYHLRSELEMGKNTMESSVDGHVIVITKSMSHSLHVRLPIDFIDANVTSLLLQNTGCSNHI